MLLLLQGGQICTVEGCPLCKELAVLPTNSEMREPNRSWLENLVRARRVHKPCLPKSLSISDWRIAESARAQRCSTTPDSAPGVPNLHDWPIEHCASEPQPFLFGSVSASTGLLSAFVVMVWLCLCNFSANATVHQVESIGLTVNDLDREVRFFTQVLPFEEISRAEIKGQAADDLVGRKLAVLKIARLRLGDENITLTEHETKGRPVPPDSRSYDHWFQHLAIVVRDMDKAYAHLRLHQVKYVSSAPQTLPEWNKEAAGIKAFYFRDPEDHVLEILWFPQGKGDAKWQKQTGSLFLGIDHTAIVVSDTESSLEFYRDLLGMRVAGQSENFGVEQEHLNQVFGARLRITALRTESGPGIEFLEYVTPPGGRHLPVDAKPNDLVFWHTDFEVDHLTDVAKELNEKGTRIVSTGIVELSRTAMAPVQSLIVRDPDGHALQLDQHSGSTASAQR
jgi:catechol 2,3-dioxygenase-like lactoylglutathione lyase family enzyme